MQLETEIKQSKLFEDVLYIHRDYNIDKYVRTKNIYTKGEIIKLASIEFVQENEVKSEKGVLRGMGYQVSFPQGKLITVIKGHIFDVFVDVRISSRTYGKWDYVELSDDKWSQVWIPPGYAHGYYAMERTVIQYKVTEYYYREDEEGFVWNDPEVGILWPDDNNRIISKKDLGLHLFRECKPIEVR